MYCQNCEKMVNVDPDVMTCPNCHCRIVNLDESGLPKPIVKLDKSGVPKSIVNVTDAKEKLTEIPETEVKDEQKDLMYKALCLIPPKPLSSSGNALGKFSTFLIVPFLLGMFMFSANTAVGVCLLTFAIVGIFVCEQLENKHPENMTVDTDECRKMAGTLAKVFLIENCHATGKIHRDTMKKKLTVITVLALVMFILMSLMMLYHRSFLLFAAGCLVCGVLTWFITKKITDQETLSKKLASMPDADMEKILMSESDQMVSEKKYKWIRTVILVCFAVLFVVLFWKPHTIYESQGDHAAVRFYSMSFMPEETVELRDTWNGLPVTSIRGNVFQNLSSIRVVKLPSQLEEIRAHAFRSCSNLESIEFPNTLRRIGSSAFRDCRKLIRPVIPPQCSVENNAFKK